MKGDKVAALQMCVHTRTRKSLNELSSFASKASGFNAWRWHILMGIPFVEILISQKSTEVPAYGALGVLIPSFADSPTGHEGKPANPQARRSHFQDVVCCS